MRQFIFLFSLLITAVLNAQVVPHDLLPQKPANARPVVDDAGILSDREEYELVAKLKAYNDSTSNQVVIVTVKTLHGYASDQYATEIGHFWGVGGQAKMDNGVVILLSTGTEEEGKRKVFIATGYGLEGNLSAIVCKKITDNEMVPFLKQGKYYQAFDNAINAIMKAAAGEYKAPDGYKKKGKGGNSGGSIILFVVIVLVIIFVLIGRRGGGGNSGMMSRRGVGNIAEGLFWASLLGGNNSVGGWSGGGSSSNNDSGSGGFGDFGGGDFGGGGAGSDW